MAWLTSLLKKPDEPVTLEEEAAAEEAKSVALRAPTGPQLAILEPDIAGISSFKLNLFHDATSAAEHLIAMRPEVRRGSHVFWALQQEPAASEAGQYESLVLIRAENNSELVYVVSFLDIESALSFTRFEVRRGLNLHNVMIYWAAWAQVREELEGVSVLPPVPPKTVQGAASVAAAIPAVEQPATEPTAPETPVEAEARATVQRYLEEQVPDTCAPNDDIALPVLDESPAVTNLVEPATVEPPATTPVESATGSLIAESLAPPVEETPTQTTELEGPGSEPLANESDFEPEGWPPPMPGRGMGGVLTPSPPVDTGPVEIADQDILQSEIPEEEAALDEAVVFQHRVTLEPEPLTTPQDEAPTVEIARHMHLAVHGTDQPVVEEIAEPQLMDAVADGLLITEADEEEAISGPVHALAGDEEIENLAPADPAVVPAEIALPSLEPEAEASPAEQPVQSYPGDEEATSDSLAAKAEADAIPEVSAPRNIDEFDVAYEVERLLNRRRFERKDSPFSGFESPPGRF